MSGELIPYHQMGAEAWRRLRVAANDTQHPMRLQSVATTTDEGGPSVRLLILRGADKSSRALWHHTDVRSRKFAELRARPRLCALAYDNRDGVQLRIFGRVRVCTDDETSQKHWDQLVLAVQVLYNSERAPGEPVAPNDPRTSAMVAAVDEGSQGAGFGNFGVLETQVDRIDWLQAVGSEQRRALLRAESGWEAEPVAP